MYSHEIANLLKIKNNLVTIKEYIEISNSPQVDHIKYEDGLFKLWTNDNYYYELRIRKEG